MAIVLKDYVKNQGILVLNNWLPAEQYNKISNNCKHITFTEGYQPASMYFENRLEAYPTYESQPLEHIDIELYHFIKTKLVKDFDLKIEKLNCFLRYTEASEINNSKRNAKYPTIHYDEGYDIAGVLYFEQGVDSGTALFRVIGDNEPDIKVGALPNRLIIYAADMLHSPVHDKMSNKRRTLLIFIKLKEE